MQTFKRSALLSLLFLLPACGKQLVEFPQADAAQGDTGKLDATSIDGVKPEARDSDVATDAGARDGAGTEVRTTDSAAADLAIGDGRSTDTSGADLRVFDVSITEASRIDASTLDLAHVDVSSNDVTNAEAASNSAEASGCRQAPVVLGTAENFVVLAGSTVTNTGLTSVTGDLGVSPGTAVTGFPPGILIGTLHAADTTAAQGLADLTTAYNDAAGRTLCAVTVSGNLGGQTLPPGLYKSTSSLAISSGDLTLDAQGDSTAVFIFQTASTLTTTAGRQVILSGGARASHVFWQVGTSATLGSTSAFQGTVMADQAITLSTGATLTGRVLARIAGVSLDANAVTQPVP
jgi:hypothetical protein